MRNFGEKRRNNANDEDRLSKTLRDTPWYFESWDNDPTIRAMLTMIDAIDEKFMHTQGLFDRLINKEGPVITFQFLNFETFVLTDDLYIKMNARGKQLTDFENFKAKYEQSIKNFSDNLPDYKLKFGEVYALQILEQARKSRRMTRKTAPKRSYGRVT